MFLLYSVHVLSLTAIASSLLPHPSPPSLEQSCSDVTICQLHPLNEGKFRKYAFPPLRRRNQSVEIKRSWPPSIWNISDASNLFPLLRSRRPVMSVDCERWKIYFRGPSAPHPYFWAFIVLEYSGLKSFGSPHLQTGSSCVICQLHHQSGISPLRF